MHLPVDEEETPSHRCADLYNPRYFSSDSEGSPRVQKKASPSNRDSRRQSLLPGARSFRIIERDGDSSSRSARRIRIPSPAFASDRRPFTADLKSTTAREAPADASKTGRILGMLSLSARSVAESVDLTKVRDKLSPPKDGSVYIKIFEKRFLKLLDSINSKVNLRLMSRHIKQTVNKRYDKKVKLLKEKQEEKKIKIYGTKVRAMNKNNIFLQDGTMDRPVERKMLKKLKVLVNQVRYTKMYFDYETEFFAECLKYPAKIFTKEGRVLTNEHQIPPVMGYVKYLDLKHPEKGTLFDMQNTELSNQVGMLAFLEYTVEVEHMVSQFLDQLLEVLDNFEGMFEKSIQRGMLVETVEGYRQELIKILDTWNLKFLKELHSSIRNEALVKKIVKDYIHQRLDARLLNLRIAKKFFDCYALVKNVDKGYLLLHRAFTENKKAVNIYLDTYIKYECEKCLMTHFMDAEELNFTKLPDWKWMSIYEWVETLNSLKKRNPFMKNLLNRLQNFLSIPRLIEILENLADNAQKTSNYYQSERYYEHLLYIYDNVDKFELIKNHFTKAAKSYSTSDLSGVHKSGPNVTESIPRSRALKNLQLNQKFVRINNEIIKVTIKNQNFEKGLSYIANNVFLYYNSVKMINDTDPQKYPKKGNDKVILQASNTYESDMIVNAQFQQILAFFNKGFKDTIALHKEIWVAVNNNFNIVDGNLYEAVKNCLETLQKIPKFSKKNLWGYITKYVATPDYSKHELRPEFLMDIYFPGYTGVIEHHEYERWVLEKLKFLPEGQTSPNIQLQNKHNYEQEIASSKNKGDRVLKVNDVIMYYALNSHPNELVSLLFNQSAYHSYRSQFFGATDSTDDYFVRKFREQLLLEPDPTLLSHVRSARGLKSSSSSVSLVALKLNRRMSVMDWYHKELSVPAQIVIQKKIRFFLRYIKEVIRLRNEKIEQEKNIIRSFRDKFLRKHAELDLRTECNILIQSKGIIQNNRLTGKSRFARELEQDSLAFLMEQGISELESKPSKRGLPILRERRHSEVRAKLPVPLKEERTAIYDRFNLTSNLQNHYFNFILRDLNPLALRYEQHVTIKQKELGPEIHIEESVSLINETNYRFRFTVNNKAAQSVCKFRIDDDKVSIGLTVDPRNSLRSSSTSLVLKLKNSLVDYKEQLLKMNDIKFQSCYPILYHFFGIQCFKPLFFPEKKPLDFSKDHHSHESTVLSILNSMSYLFPIILTQLRSYPNAIQEQFHLVHFTKYDLDAAQCLCMIMFLLSHLTTPLMTLTPVGRILPRSADLRYFVEFSKKGSLNLLGVYLIQRIVDNMREVYCSLMSRFQLNIPRLNLGSSYEYMFTKELAAILESQQDFGKVRACITKDSVNILLQNFYNFLKLYEIYERSEMKGNLSPRKSFKFQSLERTVFIGTRTWQGPDRTVCKINLHMVMNWTGYQQAIEIFNTCIDKYQLLKSISRLPYTNEEFILFALILLSEKLFGFRVSVSSFYKDKISYIKENPRSKQKLKQKNGDLSILELPRVFYPTDMEYMSFTQMLWFQTRGISLLAHLDKDTIAGKLGDISNQFSKVDWLKHTKSYLPQLYSTISAFYSDLLNQKKLRKFWVSDIAAAITEPFLYEHAKINELRHDADGIVTDFKTKFLFRFNYDKFHKTFETNHDQLIQSLVPVMLGKNNKNQLKVQYLNSLVNILQILTLKQPLAKKQIAVKRINDVVKIMDQTENRFDTQVLPGIKKTSSKGELDYKLGLEGLISQPITKSSDWENRFSRLFEKNFKEVRDLVTNDFQGETAGFASQLDPQGDPERIRNATVIQSDRTDINFTFDKLLKKKRPIVVKGQLTESLEEAEKYFLRMIEFQQKVRRMKFDYSIDIQKTFKLVEDKATSTKIKRDDYDFIIRVQDKRKFVDKGLYFSERRYFFLKVLFKYESIPFENYGQYVKISSILLKFYYPLLQSQAVLELREPCFILKFIRVISLNSQDLRDIELSSMVGHLLSRHHMKNTFENVDSVINASFHQDEKHFYMTVLDLSRNIKKKNVVSKAPLKKDQNRGSVVDLYGRQTTIDKHVRGVYTKAVMNKGSAVLIGRLNAGDGRKSRLTSKISTPSEAHLLEIDIDRSKHFSSEQSEEIGGQKDSALDDSKFQSGGLSKSINRIETIKDIDERLKELQADSSETSGVTLLDQEFDQFAANKLAKVHHTGKTTEMKISNKIEKLQKLMDLDDEDNTTRKLKVPPKAIRSDALFTKRAPQVKVSRIGFKFHNALEEQGEVVQMFKVQRNVEGYLNITFQKNIHNLKPKVRELHEISQEKVKERLIINDPSCKNCLDDLQNTLRETFSFVHKVDRFGRCHVKVSSYYTWVDYTLKTVRVDQNSPNFKQRHGSDSSNPIRVKSFFEDLLYRVKMMNQSSNLNTLESLDEGFKNLSESEHSIPVEDYFSKRQDSMVGNQMLDSKNHSKGFSMTQEHGSVPKSKPKLARDKSFLFGEMKSGFKFGIPETSLDLPVEQNIFRTEETLLLNFQLLPLNYKYRESKLILNSGDLNQLITLKEFFNYTFNSVDPAVISHKLACISPKLFYLCLLKFIVYLIEMKKTPLYTVPCFRKKIHDRSMHLKNIFTKYEHNTNIVISGFLDKVSSNLIVVYTGVMRTKGTYFVVTVYLNKALSNFMLKFYSPKVLRSFVVEVPCTSIKKTAQEFFQKTIFTLMASPNYAEAFSEYSKFNEKTLVTELVRSKSKEGQLLDGADEIDEEDESVQEPISGMAHGETSALVGREKLNSSTLFTPKNMFDASVVKRMSVVVDLSHQGGFGDWADRNKSGLNSSNSRLQAAIKDPLRYLATLPTAIEQLNFLEDYIDDPMFLQVIELWDRFLTNGKFDLISGLLWDELTKQGKKSGIVSRKSKHFYNLCKANRFEVFNFAPIKFWEQAIKSADILTTKDTRSTILQMFEQRLHLRENFLIKNIQLSENAEILFSVVMKNSELKKQLNDSSEKQKGDKTTKEEMLSMLQMTNSIFSHFEPVKYLYTSSFELELQILTLALYDSKRSEGDEQFIRRNLNLREIINLHMAERAINTGLRNIDNKVYLGDVKDLASFILYKIKTSNIFNITLSLKNEEEQEDQMQLEGYF